MRLPAQPAPSLCLSGPISCQKCGVLLGLAGVFFWGGVYFTFCFEMAAEMSLPCLTAPPPALAKPLAARRCPSPRAGPAQPFPALSQHVSAAPVASFVASFVPFPILAGNVFLLSLSCSLSRDGGKLLATQ